MTRFLIHAEPAEQVGPLRAAAINGALMELVLTVTQAPPGTQSENRQYVITSVGGTTGRAETSACHLPCPDRVVSSQHASIQYHDGQYVLVDTSKNGTDVNGSPASKDMGMPQPLKNGDIIQCGRFQLAVALRDGQMAALPKGLDAVDFLDNAPAPVSTPAFAAPAVQANSGFDAAIGGGDFGSTGAASDAMPADDLDSWLSGIDSPSSTSGHSGTGTDGWGAVAETNSANIDSVAGLSPEAEAADIFGHKAAESEPSIPAGLPQSPSWEDDDWWKGDAPSPAPSQHVHIQPQAPSSHSAVTDLFGEPAHPKPQAPAAQPAATPASGGGFAHIGSNNDTDGFGQIAPGDIAPSNIDDVMGLDAAPTPQTPPAAPQPQAPQQAQGEWGQTESAQVTPAAALQPAFEQAPPQQVPSPQPKPQTPQPIAQNATPMANVQSGETLGRLLGVNPQTQLPEPDLLRAGAKVIKESVSRLMGLIRARSNIKNELRVQHTTLQAQDNNPLKFSVNADDALGLLFGTGRSASFMSAEEAIRDSFDDLSDHQLAVMAGMQAAYDHMFKQFSPSRLENIFDAKGGILGSKGAANWDAFKNHYQRLTQDREASYNQLFGQVFAKAYEARLAELKSQRINRSN